MTPNKQLSNQGLSKSILRRIKEQANLRLIKDQKNQIKALKQITNLKQLNEFKYKTKIKKKIQGQFKVSIIQV